MKAHVNYEVPLGAIINELKGNLAKKSQKQIQMLLFKKCSWFLKAMSTPQKVTGDFNNQAQTYILKGKSKYLYTHYINVKLK